MGVMFSCISKRTKSCFQFFLLIWAAYAAFFFCLMKASVTEINEIWLSAILNCHFDRIKRNLREDQYISSELEQLNDLDQFLILLCSFLSIEENLRENDEM